LPGEHQLGAKGGILLARGLVHRWGVRLHIHRLVDSFVGPIDPTDCSPTPRRCRSCPDWPDTDGWHARSGGHLCDPRSHRSPAPLAPSARWSPPLASLRSRSACTARSDQSDSERNHCSRCARATCAPTTGSVFVSPVKVLCRSALAAASPPHSAEIPRADCSCQRAHQSASYTPPAVLVLVLPQVVSSSSSPPPFPSCYHSSSLVHKVPLQRCDKTLSHVIE